jgi:metal-responsive CopG/Arc/MetJ family transcriptional regulator
MKTAISVPDELFQEAERHAKRQRKSRSQLYAEALREYLTRRAPDEVTEAMNRVVDQVEEGTRVSDGFVAESGRRMLVRTEW